MTMQQRSYHLDRPHLRPDSGIGRRWTPAGSGEDSIELRRRRSATDAIRRVVDLAVGATLTTRVAPA